MIRYAKIFLLLTLVLTAACGFHLRGSKLANFDISLIYLNDTAAPKLGERIQARLSSNTKNFAPVATQAHYIVTLTQEEFSKNTLSVSATTGKVEEYRIGYNARLTVTDHNGNKLIQNSPISASRDYVFDSNAVLGNLSEETIIQQELLDLLVNRLIDQLRTLLAKQGNN